MSSTITLDFVLRQGAFSLEVRERLEARVGALAQAGAPPALVLVATRGLRSLAGSARVALVQ